MKINIPENLNEITIRQFFDFVKCTEESTDDTYLRLAMISIFCDISFKDIKNNLSAKEFNEISNHLTQVIKQEHTHIERFTLNGVEFGFIPNLEEITAGEYIELDGLFKEKDSYLEQMAVMYRPVIQKKKQLYQIETFENTEKHKHIMQFAPISVYFGAKVFFCNLLNELLKDIQTYLEMNQEQKQVLEATLQASGVGINQFIQSLEEMCLILKKQQTLTSLRFLHS
jgi:hypothetical protein